MKDYSSIATSDGYFTMVALDHRDILRRAMAKRGAGDTDNDLRRFKSDMLKTFSLFGESPSAVMLEPEVALPHLLEEIPPGIGVMCALEAQGYLANPRAGNMLMDGWYPGRVREVGADAAKLVVLYRHDLGEFTTTQEKLVAEVVDQASEAGVPILIEPVPIEVTDMADRREVILAAAKRFGAMGEMMLKLQYPGEGACEDLTAACGNRPWTLLSLGVPFDEYVDQLADACESGCSGFTVGRALWIEAIDPKNRTAVADELLPDRFAQLVTLARMGTRWTAALRR